MAAQHRKAFAAMPWAYQMLATRLKALPKPTYYPRDITVQMAREQIEEALRRRQLALPVMTAAHEQLLLQEAGSFDGLDYPPCIHGANCVASVYYRRFVGVETLQATHPTGFACTSVMFEDEYTAFTREGKPPPCLRPCVLCCRKTICDYVLMMRAARCTADEKTASEQGAVFLMQRQHVYQLYRNLVGQPGGYYDVYMLMPRAEEAIIDPVVMLNLSSMTLQLDAATGRRRLDQSVMHWAPLASSVPAVGELESRFA